MTIPRRPFVAVTVAMAARAGLVRWHNPAPLPAARTVDRRPWWKRWPARRAPPPPPLAPQAHVCRNGHIVECGTWCPACA